MADCSMWSLEISRGSPLGGLQPGLKGLNLRTPVELTACVGYCWLGC